MPIHDPIVLEPASEAPRHGPALSGVAERAGPVQFRPDELTRGVPAARDSQPVVPEPHAQYLGIAPSARTLRPGDGACVRARFENWFKSAAAQAPRQSYPVSEVRRA